MRNLLTLISLLLAGQVSGQVLVMPGDFPDPSVVKIGESYWATATTSNWAPAFPLLESKDLVHWELKGHVFPELPDWADYYFWAPEISYENGKVYVYYSAHRRGGNLCIGVASATDPAGPYTDHGPLVCQAAGSIDAWPMRDENGKLYLIWKEDGNSVKLPTPIWAAEMDEGRSKVSEEKKELFRNDVTWEANLVEGVSMLRHGAYFYAFYAGAGCCGRECSYGIGVARAKSLLGPWEKFPANPLVPPGKKWMCPGHGTPVTRAGKFYFLYHAYDKTDNVYPGRQGILSEFRFREDKWIEFVDPPEAADSASADIFDYFDGDKLSNHWQWSVFQDPRHLVDEGKLELRGIKEKHGAFLGRKTVTDDYEADIMILLQASSSEAGLGLVGDENNLVAATISNHHLVLRKLGNNQEMIIEEKSLPKTMETIHLRAKVTGGNKIDFLYSEDGKDYTSLNQSPVDGFFLPPWDRAVRVAVFSKGEPSEKAVFEHFILRNK